MEYCCHVLAGAPNCYLEMFDKLQKRICRTVAPSALAASLEPLAHPRNVASLSLFCRYYFGRYLFIKVHDFCVTIPRCYKDVYVNSFSARTTRPWNSLSKDCFPLTYDLNSFKSRINRHLLTVGLSKQIPCML